MNTIRRFLQVVGLTGAITLASILLTGITLLLTAPLMGSLESTFRSAGILATALSIGLALVLGESPEEGSEAVQCEQSPE